jgi:hypothetical protein
MAIAQNKPKMEAVALGRMKNANLSQNHPSVLYLSTSLTLIFEIQFPKIKGAIPYSSTLKQQLQ